MTALDAALLAHLRVARGLSERRLARLAATSPLRIRRLEAGIGHAHVTLALLDRLATALAVTPSELIAPGNHPSRPGPPPSLAALPALTLLEASLLDQAVTGSLRQPGRGPRRLAADHLVTLGVLHPHRPHPAAATTLRPDPAITAALGVDVPSSSSTRNASPLRKSTFQEPGRHGARSAGDPPTE